MLRFAMLTLVVLCVQCGNQDDSGALVPGAIRIHSAIAEAELFVDGMERGSLRDETVVELQPGPHAIEARRGSNVLARELIDVQRAMIIDVTLTQDVAAAEPNAVPDVEPAPTEVAVAPAPAEPAVDPNGIGPEAVQRVIRTHVRELQRCYSRQLSQDHDTEPLRTTVEVDISPDGTVQSARATGLLPGGMGACIETAVHRWRFPASGQPASLRFPVAFQR